LYHKLLELELQIKPCQETYYQPCSFFSDNLQLGYERYYKLVSLKIGCSEICLLGAGSGCGSLPP
jgi:hypothetical protein